MNTEQLETTNHAPFSVPGLLKTFRNISTEDRSPNDHAHVTAADLSAPFLCSEEEETLMVHSLRRNATEAANDSVANADHFWLLAAIRARKGDLTRAQALATNYIQWRSSLGDQTLNLAESEKMQRQLRRRIVFVSGNVDKYGRPILNLRPRNHDPRQFSASDSLRMITFVLEWTLRTYPASQTHGMVFVNDMTGASFNNLDIRIPGVMQKAFSKNLPVRLAAINLMNPPFILRAVVAILTALLGSKLKARVKVFGKGDEERFLELFDKDEISDDIGMGGTASWTEQQHQEWIERMIEDCKTWRPMVERPSSLNSAAEDSKNV